MTRRFSSLGLFALAGLLAARAASGADTTLPDPTAPDFKEVYNLLRTNLAGATDENLNRAAVEGLLSRFPDRVSLVSGTAGAGPPGGTALSKSAILENDVVYLRAGCVAGNLAGELSAAYRALTATNKAAGVVLDLRFTGGDDYASARTLADLFGPKKAVAGPLVVLVNGETRGAAEVLAAALRDAGAGLIIGNPTAGEAMTFKEFPLRNGEWLRIATTLVKSGNGPAIRSGGLQPDIAVTVNPDDERAFFENPYVSPARSNNDNPELATNHLLPLVDYTSEADLVREKQRSGSAGKNSPPARAGESPKPVMRDPVLTRAVDLIKGLAVMRKSHS
jgi:carboxyl-terminal processing protease